MLPSVWQRWEWAVFPQLWFHWYQGVCVQNSLQSLHNSNSAFQASPCYYKSRAEDTPAFGPFDSCCKCNGGGGQWRLERMRQQSSLHPWFIDHKLNLILFCQNCHHPLWIEVISSLCSTSQTFGHTFPFTSMRKCDWYCMYQNYWAINHL